MSEGVDEPPAESVTLRSGAGGLIVTTTGLVGFDVLAVAVILLNGLNVVTGLIAVTAALSTFVILFDMPLRTTFDDRGVTRSTPLRRHDVEWSRIDRLVRMRRGGIRRPGSDTFRGIVAVCGRKRVVLVDRTEDVDDHRRLLVVLDAALDADAYAALVAPSTSTARRSSAQETGSEPAENGSSDPGSTVDDVD